MKKIQALIVDDEPLSREGIALLLKDDAEVEVVGACADGRSALDEIRAKRPSLVFLDIQMPRLGGLETLQALPAGDRPAIIFVTAYDKYAIRAFELCAVDYLLKPFGDERFHTALGRAKQQIRQADFGEMERRARGLLEHLGRVGAPERAAESPRAPRLRFRSGRDILLLDADEIVWIEAQGNGSRLAGGGQVHRIRETLQSVEQRLDPARFLRTHRSFVVQVERIRKISSAMYGDLTLVMSDGTKVPLSRNYRAKLNALWPRPESQT